MSQPSAIDESCIESREAVSAESSAWPPCHSVGSTGVPQISICRTSFRPLLGSNPCSPDESALEHTQALQLSARVLIQRVSYPLSLSPNVRSKIAVTPFDLIKLDFSASPWSENNTQGGVRPARAGRSAIACEKVIPKSASEIVFVGRIAENVKCDHRTVTLAETRPVG